MIQQGWHIPTTASDDLSLIQQLQEVAIGQNVNAFRLVAIEFCAHHEGRAGGELLPKRPNSLKVSLSNAHFGFDSHPAIAKNEINFQSAFGVPILNCVILFLVTAGADKFNQDKVLKSAPKLWTIHIFQSSLADMTSNASVKKVKFVCR